MKLPKWILFDYGMTLCTEPPFDAVAGASAVLQYAVDPSLATPRELTDFSRKLNDEMHRYQLGVEVPNLAFRHYVYEYFGLEFYKSDRELDKIFWDAAAPASPAPGIAELLDYLEQKGIRTGVISNLDHCGETLQKRIQEKIPTNHFSFIMASSEYVFVKPNARLFELALRKASHAKPEETWFCGDNPICDIEGAHGAGIYPVWYRFRADNSVKRPECPHLEIHDWKELTATLESL